MTRTEDATSPRTCIQCLLWAALILSSLTGFGEGLLAEDETSALVTKEIDLDRLVTDGHVKETLCEPSAAVLAPWDSGLVLVGDNEARKQLYAFSVTADGLQFREAVDIPKEGGKRPRDIEALAALNDGSLLIVGSHSRKRRCETAKKRQRMVMVKQGDDGALDAERFFNSQAVMKEAMESEESCLRVLFTDPIPAHADTVCRALVAADQLADGASPSDCMAFNIEGAVGLSSDRIWIGLRSPLVDRRAIMLRLTPGHDEFRFDHAILADLGNRGIRELSQGGSRRRIWGLAGPEIDRSGPFRLWHIPSDDLASHDTIAGIMDERNLPTSSEGLVVLEDRAVVLIDGIAATGDAEGTSCEVRGRYYELPLTP